MNEAPLELDEPELPPMFGQGCLVPPGVVFGVVAPGVVLGAGVVLVGVVVVECPLAAYATPPPTLSATTVAATANMRNRPKSILLSPIVPHQNRRT